MTDHPLHTPPPPPVRPRNSLIAPMLWILALEAVSMLISVFTTPESDSPWYRELVKADVNPPSWAFGLVWPILYALIAITGYRIWKIRSLPQAQWLWPLFLLQLLMNWVWSFIFFSGHLLWPAFYWILALVAVVAALVILLTRSDRIGAALMLPYLAWICFATYLSWFIAAHN